MKKASLLLLFTVASLLAHAQKKGKGKDDKKGKKAPTEIISAGEATPVADTANKFIGIIKYRMTSDDPSEKDSMFVIFGENEIRVTMFMPGYRADQVFENTSIARFADSTLILLDPRTKTYKTERLEVRNTGTEISLINHKKTTNILGALCMEYSGEMLLKDGESYDAAALVSKQHSYPGIIDYNFLNIQPVVFGYRIVLGWRTKSADDESTYIVAYKIEKGNVDSYFDLTGYKAK